MNKLVELILINETNLWMTGEVGDAGPIVFIQYISSNNSIPISFVAEMFSLRKLKLKSIITVFLV